jgi:predicted ATPase
VIKTLTIKNFKRFRDETFHFKPTGVTLLAGGNNPGKSTILQALAIWEFCKTVVQTEVGSRSLHGPYRGRGIPVTADNFSPISLPALNHLWTNLKQGYFGGQPNASYGLRVGCQWDEPDAGGAQIERTLEFGLSLHYDRVYVKPLQSTLIPESKIPKLAYLPPFAGITAREEKLSPAAQERLIGRGLAGATLRNSIHSLYKRSTVQLEQILAGRKRLRGEERRRFAITDPWNQLLTVLSQVFKVGFVLRPFDERYHTTLNVEVFRGSWRDGYFRKLPNYNSRDIMVEGGGFLQWLSVYALAVTPEINVLLLDEPDAHLHPSLQGHLMDRLRSLARENNKQVLLATHSTEILRKEDFRTIYEVAPGKNRYLTASDQRIGLFEGIGSEYLPKIDPLRQHERVVFVEGTSDEFILRELGNRLGQPLPDTLVFWIFNGNHSQRRILFEQLRTQVQNLRGMSLRDRDELALGQVDGNLREHNHPDANGLRCRTWRRRHIENYLLLPTAIARASGQPEAVINQFLADNWGLAIGPDFVVSNCSAGLLDARGKEILTEGLPARNGDPARPSVEERFRCTRQQIAAQFADPEIPEDIRRIIQELHAL